MRGFLAAAFILLGLFLPAVADADNFGSVVPTWPTILPPYTSSQYFAGSNNGVASKIPLAVLTGAGTGNVIGPSSSTNGGYVPTWCGGIGNCLTTGLPAITSNTLPHALVETGGGGLIDVSFLPYTAAPPLTLTGSIVGFANIPANSVPANITGGLATPSGSLGYGINGANNLLQLTAGGFVSPTVMPNPSASTKGGVQSLGQVASNWINSISTSGVPSASQPSFIDISGAASLAQLPQIGINTVLGNVSGGIAAPSALTTTQFTSLCNIFAATLSGCVPGTASTATKFLRDDATWQVPPGSTYTASTGISLVGVNFQLSNIAANSVPANASGSPGPPTTAVSYGQAAAANTIAETGAGGTLAAGFLPNPSASTLGGVQSIAAVGSKWINQISTAGVPSATQPACGDLSNGASGCSTTVGTMATQNASSVAITGGTITGMPTPVNPADVVTKSYTDALSNNTFYHTPVQAAAYNVAGTAVLPNTPTFSSATCATTTLTSSTNTALVVDGYSVLLNDRVLVANQAAPAQDGIYSETQLGTGSVPWILTRATDFNSVGTGAIALGASVLVKMGTANAGFNFWLAQTAAITCNTTAISPWIQSAQTTIYTASNGITLTGSNFTLSNIAANSVPANASGSPGPPTTAVSYSATAAANTIAETGGGGTLAAGFLPNPTATTLGGIESLAAVTSKWINQISTSGVPTATQPAFTDISGQATLAQLPSIGNNTALGNVSGGTAVPVALTTTQFTSLCNLFTATLSGCVPGVASSTTNFLRADGTWAAPIGTTYTGSNGITLTSFNFALSNIAANSIPANASGSPGPPTTAIAYSATAAANTIAETGAGGTLAAGFLPPPSVSTLGGIQSLAQVTSKWINQISTAGVPSASQPGFSDLTGSATLGQLPSINNNTVLGNVSGGSAVPSALTAAQITTLCNPFTTSLSGCVNSSPGGTTNFLRADGVWAAPPGAASSFPMAAVTQTYVDY